MRLAGFSPPDLEAILASVCHTENVQPVGELTAQTSEGTGQPIARWVLEIP